MPSSACPTSTMATGLIRGERACYEYHVLDERADPIYRYRVGEWARRCSLHRHGVHVRRLRSEHGGVSAENEMVEGFCGVPIGNANTDGKSRLFALGVFERLVDIGSDGFSLSCHWIRQQGDKLVTAKPADQLGIFERSFEHLGKLDEVLIACHMTGA